MNGHLLYLQGRTLMAQSLDLEGRRLTGEPRPLVANMGATTTGYSAFSISTPGTLAYSEPWPTEGELIWHSREGRQIGAPIAPLADYVDFSLSPDATRLAMSRVDAQTNTSDIWLLDIGRSAVSRLTSDRFTDAGPMWSPDGASLVFRSNRTGMNSLYRRSVGASRPEELVFRLVEESSSLVPSGMSRDGSRVLATVLRNSWDIWSVAVGPEARATPVLETEFDEYKAVLSPDGRWMAYVSEETGTPEVFVQSFPDGQQRWQVSASGGTDPQWRADGAELFFLSHERMLMAAPISVRVSFSSGPAVPLFQTRVPVSGNPYRQAYAATADGQRFLVNTAPADAPSPAIQVVLDWRALLDTERKP